MAAQVEDGRELVQYVQAQVQTSVQKYVQPQANITPGPKIGEKRKAEGMATSLLLLGWLNHISLMPTPAP